MAVSYGACSSLVNSRSVRLPVRSWTSWTTCWQAAPSRLPGTRQSNNRLSGSTAVWSQSSPRSRSSGSVGSQDFSFWKTKAHFSSSWTSRVVGGKGHQFLVEGLGMGAGQGEVACDGVLVHTHQASGGPRPATLAEVIQDIEGLRVGQSRLLQDGPLAFGEAGRAGAAVGHADAVALAAPATEGEVSPASAARIGALGILATDVLDGDHADPP